MNIISLKSRERYKVKHNGKQMEAALVAAPASADSPGIFIREHVEIDGVRVNVVAVDMDGGPEVKKGQPISLIYESTES